MTKQENFHKWILIEKLLWLQLCHAGFVYRNDPKAFYLFGAIVAAHLEKDEIPTFDEIHKEMEIKKRESFDDSLFNI